MGQTHDRIPVSARCDLTGDGIQLVEQEARMKIEIEFKINPKLTIKITPEPNKRRASRKVTTSETLNQNHTQQQIVVINTNDN